MCRLVYYRIRKGEQCFDCRATLWTVVAWKSLEGLDIIRDICDIRAFKPPNPNESQRRDNHCILCFCAAYLS